MRNLTLTLLISFFSQFIFAQENTDIISIEYSNINRKAALEKMESITNYKFYFEEEWLDNKVLISGNYQNKPLTEVISGILEDTNLNFFIDKKAADVLYITCFRITKTNSPQCFKGCFYDLFGSWNFVFIQR